MEGFPSVMHSRRVPAVLLRRSLALVRRSAVCSSPLLASLRRHSTAVSSSPSETRTTVAVLLNQQRLEAQTPSVSQATASPRESTEEQGNAEEVTLSSPEEVEATFRNSVEARTVSNAQLRRYVHQLAPKDYALGLAAVKGAKAGGLKLSPQVYEALLELLMNSGQLRAAMELYQSMVTTERVTPTPHTYALLMELCLQREMPDACQRLFRDMQKRGMRPSGQNYQLMLSSLAAQSPPKWEEAIAIFDKLNRERKSSVNAQTYNALMGVYLKLEPFDWRVVYNCYQEMRSREPPIPLEWDSYLLLKEALRRGNAGRLRRFTAFLDAWVQTTPLQSADFVKGVLVYLAVMWLLKSIIGYVFVWYMEASGSARRDSGGGGAGLTMVSESLLPTL